MDGLFVCHHCDNPACVNPDHLFLGTLQDNVDDMCRKGRQARRKGEAHCRARLTDEAVRSIRRQYGQIMMGRTHAPDGTISLMAAKYGVSNSAITGVVYGKSWTHVV